MANNDAYKALKDEADKLSNPKRPVWLMDSVTERWKVKERAKKEGIKVHFARLFGFVVQKGSELAGGKPRFKGRIVVQGNDVRDEEGNQALFNELGASPATSESAKLVDAFGLLPGHDITTDDGCQAYCQALLG